ncbi:hypothetical protein E2C01_004139 [Portunus trituberculatus]|uniref:Uncharacterized protein n=1 Tax=Portunus trituberculatus TaxID=210409 RepID=A0A5B7CP41_PORTR|nr:hypothetical protein [Portunus trituberculatus]
MLRTHSWGKRQDIPLQHLSMTDPIHFPTTHLVPFLPQLPFPLSTVSTGLSAEACALSRTAGGVPQGSRIRTDSVLPSESG